jgi:hypothetical protein
MKTTKIDYRVTDDNNVIHAFSIKFKGELIPNNFGDKTKLARRIGCSCGRNHLLLANKDGLKLENQEIYLAQSGNYGFHVNLGTGEIIKKRFPGGS